MQIWKAPPPPSHHSRHNNDQNKPKTSGQMYKLPQIFITIIIISACFSCRTHKNTYTHTQKIGFDSVNVVQSCYDWRKLSAINTTIQIKDYTISNGDTTNIKHIIISSSKTDSICSHFSQTDSNALQSHQIDSVVQVTTKGEKVEHSANKWGFWAYLKYFSILVCICVALVYVYKLVRLFR